MKKTVFDVPKMDCPSEERIIRMTFEDKDFVKNLSFDLSKRQLEIVHEHSSEEILSYLLPLGFGAKIKSTDDLINFKISDSSKMTDEQELKDLKIVFAINATMFVVGIVFGIIAQSAGLIADSLDMFADAAVFGLSIYAVGRTLDLKKKAARVSGYLQLALAVGAFVEVLRRIFLGNEPIAPLMMTVALVALIANATCMYVLSRHRKGEAHMQASWIFLSNDVIANMGVILAGLLVKVTKSAYPDLIIGTIIVFVVLSGSVRILRSSR